MGIELFLFSFCNSFSKHIIMGAQESKPHVRTLDEDKMPYIDQFDKKECAKNPVEAQYSQMREAREKCIAVTELRQLEKKLERCYFIEDTNHQFYCKELVADYLQRIADPDYLHSDPTKEFAKVNNRSSEYRF